MKFEKFVALVLAASLGSASAAQALEPPPDRQGREAVLLQEREAKDTHDCTAVLQNVNRIQAFNQGDLSARECAVRLLQQDARLETDYLTAKAHVAMLQTFYSRRAQRQQTFLDLGSLVTIGGAAGAFEGGISASTRQAWVIAGVLPSIIGRFNTYEPTRELFQGGALAVHLITLRHDRIRRAITLLKASDKQVSCQGLEATLRAVVAGRAASAAAVQDATAAVATAATAPPARKAAAELAATSATARARDVAYDADGVLLAEARRLRNTCAALNQRALAVRAAQLAAENQATVLAGDYANDILSLDRALIAKDRDLRYSPIETLSAIVASPFRAVDALVTGESPQVALDSLKTQIAFSGINRSLASIPLPALPPTQEATGTVAPLSAEAIMLTGGRASTLVADVGDLRSAADLLAVQQQELIYNEGLAADLFGAAAANYLTFTYDAPTGTTTVTIGPVPASATISGTTAAP